MRVKSTIPCRINILGNPSDANEGEHQTISAAVRPLAGAFLTPAPKLTLEVLRLTKGGAGFTAVQSVQYMGRLRYDGKFDLIKAAINILAKYSEEFKEKLGRRKVKIATWTDVPRQSGLGGSSSLILVTLGSLRAFYRLDPFVHNDYFLAEMTQRAEANELGITCGYADRYVPIFGDIAYIDYRGKLFQKEFKAEPYATYEKLGSFVNELPLVIFTTGIEHDSGDVHGPMRARYLKEYRSYVRHGGRKPPLVNIMEKIGDTAWRGKQALLEADWVTFGTLMNENHRLADRMMRYCGFTEGAGAENNFIIRTALSKGALAAKLTGAGGGGSVFALTEPGGEAEMISVLKRAARERGLANSSVRKCRIVRGGLRVETS